MTTTTTTARTPLNKVQIELLVDERLDAIEDVLTNVDGDDGKFLALCFRDEIAKLRSGRPVYLDEENMTVEYIEG